MALIPNNFAQILPSIAGWVEGLSTDPLANALQDVFAQIEVFHILGLFLLGCSVILVSLRLLGAGLVEATPNYIYRNTRWWLHIGVVMGIVSGLLMGLSNASKLYDNTAFLWKMIALVAAVIYSYAVLVPVAKYDGRLTSGARIGLFIGTAVWALSLIVMVVKQGANVGIFHVLFAGTLVAIAATTSRLRWTVVIVSIVAAIALQIVTHGVIKDPFTTQWMLANKVFMWAFGLFLLAVLLLNIAGRGAARDTTTMSRLVGYTSILVWVTVAAGGRWIGLT